MSYIVDRRKVGGGDRSFPSRKRLIERVKGTLKEEIIKDFKGRSITDTGS